MRILVLPSLVTLVVTFSVRCLGQTIVAPPTFHPAAITSGIATTVTVTALITSSGAPVLPNGVNILQVDQAGNNARIIGTMNDNGIGGDFFANDGIFGGTVTLSQATVGRVYLQVSAAFSGELRRTLSPVRSIPVTAPGVPNTPQPTSTLTSMDLQTGATVVCNELLVTFEPGASQQSISSAIQSVGGTLVGMLAELGVYQLTIPSCNSLSLSAAQATLAANPAVNFAELDAIETLSQISGSPNDPYFINGHQWGLTNIKASQAWSFASAVPGVAGGTTIGIIDTGINSNHEDLLGQVIPGVNWCASVYAGNCTALGVNTNDDVGHGTMVAGIAAAITNNDLGVASPAYRANLIAEKVNFPASGDVTSDAIANAITDAVFRGARVINISSGSTTASHTLNLAITDAVAKGVVIVAAAGNYGDSTVFFPAAYGSVISVGASDQNNQRAVWNFLGIPGNPCSNSEPASDYGRWVTVYAPGSEIFGLLYNQTSGPSAYGYYGGGGIIPLSCSGDGTSLAAPFVTGAVSLMLAVNPNLTPADVKTIIESSAVNTGKTDPDGNPINLLDMNAAVQNATLPYQWLSFLTGNPGTPGDGRFVTDGPSTYPAYDAIFVDGATPLPVFQLQPPIPLSQLGNGFTLTVFPSPTTPILTTVEYNIYFLALNPPLGCPDIVTWLSWGPVSGTTTVNGVTGYYINFFIGPDFALTTTPGCTYQLNDQSFALFDVFAPYSFTLDAASIGIGLNNVPH